MRSTFYVCLYLSYLSLNKFLISPLYVFLKKSKTDCFLILCQNWFIYELIFNFFKISFLFNLNLDADIDSSSAIEAFECSLNLFPHLIYISNLTKDFVNRAAGVLEIQKNQSFLQTDITFIHVLMSESRPLPRRCKCTYVNL